MTIFYNLGSYTRPVLTKSAEAQRWFDQGLLWLYGYNHGAAVEAFRQAIEHDPTCVMAYWGIAYGVGCNYNKRWEVFTPPMVADSMAQARSAIDAGLAHLDQVSPVEGALLNAVEKRFQAEGAHPTELLESWNDEYADAMREVYRNFDDDPDVAALFAEALINRTPWKLWDLEARQPAEEASTAEAIEVLEGGIAQQDREGAPPHPGLHHLYIHVMEMSPHPEKALPIADRLRELVPDAGHLKHMPSHIDILCGDYYAAVRANERAIEVDNLFAAQSGELNEYIFYRAHDVHFKIYAAMLLGQYAKSMEAVEEMAALAHDGILRIEQPPMADHLEGMLSMRFHVLIRFGRWSEILEQPFPTDPELYCNTTVMLHYARAIAFATLGRFEEADTEHSAFSEAASRVPESRYIFNNMCIDILEVARAMLDGEVAYHQGEYDRAFESLRQAVYLDDHLAYAEPWGWMMPTRHALGALLLEQGHVEEAAAIYRADLGLDQTIFRPMQHPNNVWSLHGYVTCLRRLGRQEEAAMMQMRLDLALARTDVEIDASCFCAGALAGLATVQSTGSATSECCD